MNKELFKKHLEWAEDRRNFPYDDSVGKTTIGVGRNLDAKGLSESEIDFLLDNDIAEAIKDAERLPYWVYLNTPRQIVVADMIFNMGYQRFIGFVKTNDALSRGYYDAAAYEMEDSKWHRQTKRRAEKLVRIMRGGVWE